MQATLAISLMLACLGAAFFRTQVIRNDEFNLRADDNRFRPVPIAAPRGTVFDRDGNIIAETVAGYTLAVEPGPTDSVRARILPLLPLVGLDTSAMDGILERAQRRPLEPVIVSDALSFAQMSRLAERRNEIPWAILDPRPIRRYPHGEAVAHLVGYVGEISDRELDSPDWQGYRSGQLIGKGGIERQYEKLLGGKPGARYVEVDSRGKVVGRFAEQHMAAPVPGQDIRLTIDLDLQRFVHSIFPRDFRGAVVAMEPSTGEILAMYSFPTYDPNLLVGSIPTEVWRELNTNPGRPLLNRATNGVYPPASTWKLATALVGLERGAITPAMRMPIGCSGGMSFAGRYSRCWKKEGHGSLDLAGAIAQSCNVYFYQVGVRLTLDRLAREGARLGFGRKAGLDLPEESAGTFPDSRDWYLRRFGWRPTPSEVMSLSIGQGPNSQTPLRMAQFFSAMAGDGTARRPHLLRSAETLPVETDLRVSRTTLEAVRVGMAAVLERGTAAAVNLRRWKLYGKTGTAQNSTDTKRPHAWFTGFAGPPGGQPEIAMAVIVELGEHGNTTAAPVASRLAEFYLNKKHGIRNAPLPDADTAPRPATAPARRPATTNAARRAPARDSTPAPATTTPAGAATTTR